MQKPSADSPACTLASDSQATEGAHAPALEQVVSASYPSCTSQAAASVANHVAQTQGISHEDMQEGGAEFSLGGSMLGCIPAPGYVKSANSECPTAWLALLTTKHAEAAQGLTCASRASRDCMLREAGTARLCVNAAAHQSDAEWAQQLQLVQRDLQARGALPTCVVLQCQPCTEDVPYPPPAAELHRKVHDLFTSASMVPELRVVSDRPHQSCSEALVWLLAAPALASLTALDTQVWPAALPEPAALPSLTSIEVSCDSFLSISSEASKDSLIEGLFLSTAPYMQQLETLSIEIQKERADPLLPHLLTPHTTSHTLSHLDLSVALTDTLITLITQYAPNLRSFAAHGIHIRDNSNVQWGLEELFVYECWEERVDDALLVRLPRRASGRLEVVALHVELRMSAQGFTPAFQERVSDFVLTARVTLCLCGGADEAAALRNTLAQCGELRLGKGSVCESQAHIKGYNWQWSDAAVQAAVQGIPQLPHLTFAFNCNGALTDALLGAALQLGGCMRQLYADRVSLQSDEHAGAVWPWEKVYMDSLRVSELYKMPMPRDGAVVCVEHLSSFVLDQTEPVLERLKRLEFVPDSRFVFGLGHQRGHPEPANPHEYLSACFETLRAMRLRLQEGDSFEVCVPDYPLTREVVESLQGLPHWPGQLDLHHCEHRLGPDDYRRLAEVIPASYHMWSMSAPEDACRAVLEEAVQERRAQLGLDELAFNYW